MSTTPTMTEHEDEVPRLAYSVPEVARRAAVSRQTLYREIAAGRLRAKRIRGRVVIPADALAEWLDSD